MGASRDRTCGEIAELLRKILKGYVRPFRRPPVSPEVTIGQLHCLQMIERLGDPAMSELAEELRLQPSSVTALVDGLVEHGLAERRDDPQDRRIVRVALTRKGARNKERVHEAVRQRIADLLRDVSAEDLRKIRDALALFHDAAARRAAQGAASGLERDEDESS